MIQEEKHSVFKKRKWKYILSVNCLGVKIGIRSDRIHMFSRVKNNLSEILPLTWHEISKSEVEHWISIFKDGKSAEEWTVYKDEEMTAKNREADLVYDLIVSKIRATVAEFAVDFVFLHAGAVSYRGSAIIIPGKSCSGKTTLVTELIKRNCEYLSDEFAVIDKNGLVHPFAKKLSVRGIIDEYRQVDIDASDFGGISAIRPVPAGFLLTAEYKKKRRKPLIKINSSGNGVMASVANSISVRQNPKFVLEVLSRITAQAVVLEATRGEASEFADYLLAYLDKLDTSVKSRAV